ncbi:MAG: aspartate-semialdehyde dehydrogenase [Polyangiaceae bacterium]|nr:aspartate-semialdehyde dehydrogenase [Polyangiaceae bacterium]
MNQPKTVAIVGATGAVGVELIGCLERRKFPVKKLVLLASARSKGKVVKAFGQDVTVEELTLDSFAGVDIALFAAGGSISKKFAKAAVQAGAIVVDNSSAFRMDPEVPLVVPEINPEAVKRHKGIIANPNCSTIIGITPLWPIHKVNPIKRLQASTYQAASGAGAAAMEELEESTRAHLEGRSYELKVLPHPYAFNLFSHNSSLDQGSGYNEEELKMVNETHKIFGDPNIHIAATCVRVPVLRAHTEALTVQCERPVVLSELRALLEKAPGVRVVDDRQKNYFPMPKDASGKDDILVGRLRLDTSDPSGKSFMLLVAGDQLLKGAALNAVQIAELL